MHDRTSGKLESEIRNLRLHSRTLCALLLPVQSEISDFGFELQESCNFEIVQFPVLLESEIRNLRLHSRTLCALLLPVQSEISDFGFELQESYWGNGKCTIERVENLNPKSETSDCTHGRFAHYCSQCNQRFRISDLNCRNRTGEMENARSNEWKT